MHIPSGWMSTLREVQHRPPPLWSWEESSWPMVSRKPSSGTMVPISQMRNLRISSQKMVIHSASNGQVEWAVRTFKEGIEKMEEWNVQDKKSRFLLKYKTTLHTTTGVTQVELLMKRTKLDLKVQTLKVWRDRSKNIKNRPTTTTPNTGTLKPVILCS